jgi:hypothetical protein
LLCKVTMWRSKNSQFKVRLKRAPVCRCHSLVNSLSMIKYHYLLIIAALFTLSRCLYVSKLKSVFFSNSFFQKENYSQYSRVCLKRISSS